MQRKYQVYLELEPRLSPRGRAFSQSVRAPLKQELLQLQAQRPGCTPRQLEGPWVAAHVPVYLQAGWLALPWRDQLRITLPGVWDGLRLAPAPVLGLGLRTVLGWLRRPA